MKKDKEFHMVCFFCMLAYCEKSLWTYKASILCIASLCLGIGKKPKSLVIGNLSDFF